MQKILQGLNPKQEDAVKTIKGPVLVIAGPGSGKTLALTHRVAYLIAQKIKPENILAVTFTNKAAEEMRERIDSLTANQPNSLTARPTICTFHSLCARILRKELPRKHFTIYDESDQLSLIKQVIKDLQIDKEQFKPKLVLNHISSAKSELIDENDYAESANEYFTQTISKIYFAYQNALNRNNALDFDDLIMKTVQLLQKKPKILKGYQNKFKYILVDEYQDTDHSQYVLLNLLAQKHQNLFIIGDIDQSIYTWRGADFRNILNFEKDYPKTKIIMLEENYRSTKNILAAASHIIAKNILRKEKNLWTQNPKGQPIKIIEADNEKQEGYFIISEIEKLISQKNLGLNDFTVLYRTHAQSRAIEETFLKYNFPYKIIGGIRFYERKEIKDVLAYLKLLQNPLDTVSQERIKKIRRPLPKVNKKLLPREILEEILEKIDYKNYLKDDERWENVSELFTVIQKYNDLGKFLEDVSLLSQADEVDNRKNLVNLMTFHSAKGLEFKNVFIIGLEEGIFPHSKSMFDQSEMEEERRLCYVAMTRAKENLYLIYACQRHLYGSILANPPSRFLEDLPNNVTTIQKAGPALSY